MAHVLLPRGQIYSGRTKLTAASLQHVNTVRKKKTFSIIDPLAQIPHYFIVPVSGKSLRMLRRGPHSRLALSSQRHIVHDNNDEAPVQLKSIF